MLRRAVLGLALIGLAVPGSPQDAPPTAVQVPRRSDGDPASPTEAILYRQLDLWHFRRTREQHEEILDRLWSMGSPYYCRGLARLGDDYRLGMETSQALGWYRRAVRECSVSGWATLSIAGLAVANPGVCGQAIEMLADRAGADGSKLPFAAAEPGWSAEDLEYLGVVGAAMIGLACGSGVLDPADLQAMVAHRGRRSFGAQADRMEPYVQAMVRADVYGRVGRDDEARRHLGQAVREVCRVRGADQAMVDATPRETDTPLAFHLDLGAAGLLRELWEERMIEGLGADERRCMQELLHSLRRQFRFDPSMDRPEVRDWYADLDRQLRQPSRQ